MNKQIKRLVSDKMKNRAERISEAGEDLEENGNILADYRLYFSGGLDVLKAAQVPADNYKALQLAFDTNEAEMKLLEHRINLEEELQDEDDETDLQVQDDDMEE